MDPKNQQPQQLQQPQLKDVNGAAELRDNNNLYLNLEMNAGLSGSGGVISTGVASTYDFTNFVVTLKKATMTFPMSAKSLKLRVGLLTV